jgi:hypothetical protein
MQEQSAPLYIEYGVIKTQIPFDPDYGKQFDFSA